MPGVTKYEEYYKALEAYPLDERIKLVNLEQRFQEVACSRDKVALLRMIAEQEGASFGSVRRKYYAWRDGGIAAIADKRRAKEESAENIYYNEFKRYTERDKNTSAGGYEAMMRDFRCGYRFGFGTWREVFAREFPFEAVPEVCPRDWTPRGMTYQNLMRLSRRDPARALAVAWTRQGQFAALKYTMPVLRSRVGLKVGAVIQSDDVWHNIDVFKYGIKGVFNPLEFAFYDVASGFKCLSAVKPRLMTIDPKTGKERRDNLKEFQYRMAVAYLMTEIGFHRDGVTLIGERGTSALRDDVLRKIAAVPGYGCRFHFSTSGVKNTPAHAGLMMGNAGGNPRMKSLCECAHNIIHNATASLTGSHGRDAAHYHESQNALVKYSTDIIEQASRINPSIVPLLQLPILSFDVYMQYFRAIEDYVMDRTEINLEGWQDNVVMEYRLSVSSPWRSIEELKTMSQHEITAIGAILSKDRENLMRQRKMSRREVWKAGQAELDRWPLIDMPAFLDPRDAREAMVREDGLIVFEDAMYYPGEQRRYVAQYRDRQTGIIKRIAPGTKVRFYWNALGNLANFIWLTDENDDILGICKLMKSASWNDEHSIKVAMGQQQAQIAELMADTREAGKLDAIKRLANEKMNAALIEAAKAEKEPGTGNGEPGTENREPGTGNGEPGTGNGEPGTGNGDNDSFLSEMNNISKDNFINGDK